MHEVIRWNRSVGWEKTALRNVWQVAALPKPRARILLEQVREFLEFQEFESREGLELTDEILVTIATQVCLLSLGWPGHKWESAGCVLVYPHFYLEPAWESSGRRLLYGEASLRVAVVLSWEEVRASGESASVDLLVAHEFAHLLDLVNGGANGRPALRTESLQRSWNAVMEAEFEEHCLRQARARPAVLSAYAASDAGEFFAEASATFFQMPWALRDDRPALYALFSEYYSQDPAAEWRSVSGLTANSKPKGAENDPSRFIELCTNLIASHPDQKSAYSRRAGALADAGRFEEALADLDSFLIMEPDEPDVLRFRADILLSLGRASEAVQALDAVLELVPDWALVIYERGWARREMGDVAGALRDLDLALAHDDELDLAWCSKGVIAMDCADWPRALEFFDRAAQLNPAEIVNLQWRSSALARVGALDEAQRVCDMCLASNADDGSNHVLQSEIHFARHNYQAALASAERALALAPDSASAYASRAAARLELGDRARALSDLEHALALDPKVFDGQSLLAKLRS